MSNACGHSQLVGQREFCPDCGLSRNEVLLFECAPFLKDDETPAECIRRNRKDVDGCLSMLIDEKRKNNALRAERDEAAALLRELVAMIHGECPSLLDEDRGGDVRLALRIDAFLANLEAKP